MPNTEEWKAVRDEMIQHLRAQLTAETPPELVTLMAKFEVKLKSIQCEVDFIIFNERCGEVTEEVTESFAPQIRLEMLKRLTS